MPNVALSQLVPLSELSPGAVGAIRNQVIDNLVKFAAREIGLREDQLIVRDLRPVEDLQMYSGGTTTATIEDWAYTATTSTGYISVTGTQTMGRDRYVAIFGVRDLRIGLGTHASATIPGIPCALPSYISLVKINVGGGDKAIWDTKVLECYTDYGVAFSPAAVIIPQNASFNISYYKLAAGANRVIRLQLIGVTVEPRGRTISP